MWDPALYRRFATERARPFFDLVTRVGADDPGLIVDLGCGSGELTASLASRWPAAEIRGIDSSAEMIDAARKLLATQANDGPGEGLAPAEADSGPAAGPPDRDGDRDAGKPDCHAPRVGRLSFALGDVRTWRSDRPIDVIVSNAVLQWVPGHLDLLVGWTDQLTAGGWLAFQVPGNFDQPAYQVLRRLIGSTRWRSRLADVDLNQQGGDPAEYVDLLARAGRHVDAWETTYMHVLQGDDPVLRWYLSTGLRPVLAALDPETAEVFLAEYGALLRAAYPAASYGTVFPFRRVFVVARRAR